MLRVKNQTATDSAIKRELSETLPRKTRVPLLETRCGAYGAMTNLKANIAERCRFTRVDSLRVYKLKPQIIPLYRCGINQMSIKYTQWERRGSTDCVYTPTGICCQACSRRFSSTSFKGGITYRTRVVHGARFSIGLPSSPSDQLLSITENAVVLPSAYPIAA